jgi:hypothetical protein
MKKKLLMSLIILGSATALISYPIKGYAAEETTAAAEAESAEDTGEESTDGEAPEEGETSEDGEPIETEPKETVPPEPEISYYVIVTNDEGAMLYQEASQDSSLSINIPIPRNTVLHITNEATDENGDIWGFTNYSDLKEGYLKLTDLSTIQTKTAKEFVEDKLDGNWGQNFVKVDGSGAPVSFNALSQEDLDKAEESNAAAANRKSTEEETTEVQTYEDGSPVIDVTMETDEKGNYYPMMTDEDGNLVPWETDKDGNPVPWETDAEGNVLPLATDEDGNPVHPETEPPPEPEKKTGGFSIVSFIIGFFTVIILEVLVAAVMILLRRLKRKKQLKQQAAAEGGAPPEDDAGGGKKKGIKLPIPKIKLPKIKIPKIKIGGKKKKKKGEDAEE